MKSKRAAKSSDLRFHLMPSRPDYGPQERWQHSCRSFELTEKAGVLAARALEEHALDTLHLRGWIDEAARDAGIRLKDDHLQAGLAEHVVGHYNPVRGCFSPFGAWDERTDDQEAAYQRWRNAVRALAPDDAEPVLSVTCHETFPTLRQMPHLKRGLQALVKWYGIDLKKNKDIAPSKNKSAP